MNRQAITEALEVLYNAAYDAGAGDEAAIAFFDFALMIPHFKLGDEARRFVDKNIRMMRETVES